MIRELFIKNFAIIKETHIKFEDGMTVLTGETGAGKSIIIDAISQLLGQRANASLVKDNESKALIEAILDINEQVKLKLDEFGIEYDDDYLVVSKEILDSGKSTCRINYRTISASLLKQIMPELIDIHSQFDTTDLLNPKNYLSIIDNYHYDKIILLLNEYRLKYKQYIELKKQYEKLENDQDNYEQIEFYQSQLNEINQFDFENESVDDLEEESRQLQNFEKIQKNISNFKYYASSDNGTTIQFYNTIKALEPLSHLDDFEELYNILYDLYYKTEDAIERVFDTFNALDFDEYRYNEIQEKLYIVQKLKRKYSPSVEGIIEKKKEIEAHIDFLNNREETLHKLNEQIHMLHQECLTMAEQIHEIRSANALEISRLVTEELHQLYMEHAVFEIKVEKSSLTKNGFDEVMFLILTNKGQELHPIAQIASGGELSRVMLSLKTILLNQTALTSIIFDEVDTGVSGKVAYAMGQKMAKIAHSKQVLCITHLPQVACFASHHLSVNKYIQNNETLTKVTVLDDQQRIEELAKMLSGDVISDVALMQAKTLLEDVKN